jgi:chemotaxis protein MotB
MNYLLTLDFAKRYNIKPLITASGRSYLDAVKVNGVEDKEASRRIEIKFRLKNEDAMHEIEKVLDAE